MVLPYPAGVNRLQLQAVLDADVFVDGEPKRRIGRSDVGITDGQRLKPRRRVSFSMDRAEQ